MPKVLKDKALVGWSEWCQLTKLKVPYIKAKIDTGAKTSALHAFNIRPVRRNRKEYVQFDVHPIQRNEKVIVPCKARIIDERSIMSSTGHQESRFIIQTLVTLGEMQWEIELSLSNREPLRHRMLLGREALAGRVVIEPSQTLLQTKVSKSELAKCYQCSTQDV